MADKATTVKAYIDNLPADRAKAIKQIRAVIKKNLDPKVKEGIQYGMIGYFVPHTVYPHGYHCDPKQPLPFVSLASQKSHMAVYMSCIYSDPKLAAWFAKAWKAAGKKLNMGKSCVRFKSIDEVPLEVIGEAISRMTVDQFIEQYEAALPDSVKKKRAAQTGAVAAGQAKTTMKAPAQKSSAKKTAKKSTKKVASKKVAVKKVTRKTSAKRDASKKTVKKTKKK